MLRLPAHAGSSQRPKPSGAFEGLAVPWGAFRRLPARHGGACGPRHMLRREREVRPGQPGGPGMGRGREGGPLVPHDRMQGGGDGSALGFCEGKALYPPVLTPRTTAGLREGKMRREGPSTPRPIPPPSPRAP